MFPKMKGLKNFFFRNENYNICRSGALDNLKDQVNERKKKLRDANNRRKREIEEKLGCLREAELRNAQ